MQKFVRQIRLADKAIATRQIRRPDLISVIFPLNFIQVFVLFINYFSSNKFKKCLDAIFREEAKLVTNLSLISNVPLEPSRYIGFEMLDIAMTVHIRTPLAIEYQ